MATENLAPQVISRLLGEIRDLVKRPGEGIEYIENEEMSVSEIYAIINGPEDTPFYGGKFKMKLIISEDYPNSPPQGYFLTKIFHPNISLNGDICVNTLKKDWNSQVTLSHILQVIRCLLIVPFPESSLNDEAGKMFMESYEEFAKRAKIMTDVHAKTEGRDAKSGGLYIDQKEGASLTSDSDPSAPGTDALLTIKKKKLEKDVKKKNLKRL